MSEQPEPNPDDIQKCAIEIGQFILRKGYPEQVFTPALLAITNALKVAYDKKRGVGIQ